MTQISNYKDYVNAVNEAKLHDYRYFTLNAPTISDEEYDRLYFAIQDYETQHPEHILPDSPTQSAHAEVKNGHKQIRRRTEMLSTEKAQTIEKVQKWMKKTTKKLATVPGDSSAGLYTVEWKYDGISLSLVYIDGQLTEASYGKGMEGNDCLAHCLKVASIPNTIPAAGRVEVRGEMVVPFANLAKTGYKNCRSAASGIMADTASPLTDCLEFYPYWTDIDADERYGNHQSGKMFLIYTLGFNTLGSLNIPAYSIDNIADVIEKYTNDRPTLPFPTDGLVIKVDKMEQWDSLGRNDHHPHYAIAYKFAAATAETTIKDIQINIGKTGKRTPVAYFEPIVINGATYQKASVGSEDKLAQLGIEVGSRVIVSLRNDVIPHIDHVVNENETLRYETADAYENETADAYENENHVIAAPEIEENSLNSCNSLTEKENSVSSVPSVCSIEENQQAEYTENTEDVSLNPCNSLTEETNTDNTDNADAEVTLLNPCNQCSEQEQENSLNPCNSLTEKDPPYTAPAITPVTPAEPLCSGYPPRPEHLRRKYRMVGDPRIHRHTDGTASVAVAQEPEPATWQKIAGATVATIAVIAIAIALFSTIGIAVFLLPLLAGAFK